MVCAMVTVSSVASLSVTPVIVTVCGVFQSDVVKVITPLTMAAPISLLTGVIVTLPVGNVLSTTV